MISVSSRSGEIVKHQRQQIEAGKNVMYIHVYIYICTYVCMYVCMYITMYVGMYVCMYKTMQVYIIISNMMFWSLGYFSRGRY